MTWLPHSGSLVLGNSGVRTIRALTMVLLLVATGVAACARAETPTEVKVTEVEFSIQASQTAFSVGQTYRFVVSNRGEVDHEFLLIPPEEDLPRLSTVDQLYSYGRAHIPDIPPGATKTIDYTFSPSDTIKLEMACYFPGQHDVGMFLPITVT